MFINTMSSLGMVGAILVTCARAWAGSRAGMIPSARQQSWKASSASWSVAAGVFDAADFVQPGMFGADAGVVQPGADAVRLGDLAVIVLQQVGAVAVQHAGSAAGEAGGVLVGIEAAAGGLDTHQAHVGIVQEGVEQAHGVGPAADRGDGDGGEAALGGQHLGAGFGADDGLEVAHHGRVGMGAGDGADEVVGVVHIGDPVAHGVVHRVLQRASAGADGHDFGTQQFHAEHVGGPDVRRRWCPM